MAEQKIIDLPPLAIQALTDIYEVSANGALSSRETRLQMLDFMISNIAGAPYTIGDIVYADSATTLNKIPGTAVGDVLLSDGVGVAPKYGLVNLTTSVSNVLPVVNGGTGDSSYIDGELLIGNSTGSTLTKSTLTAGTGISVVNGSGSITIAATGDQNIEYQDVYDNTVATSGDANTDLSNGFPYTLSSTTELARPFPDMTIAQSTSLVLPINGGQLWNADSNRIRSNRGSDVTPIWGDVAYQSDIPVIVNDGAYAEISFQGNATETVIVTQSVPVQIAGTYVAGPLADFTHLNGVLTYTGVATRVFKVSFTISTTADLSAIDVSALIALNGSGVSASTQSEFLGSATPAFHVVTVQALVSLSTNDTLSAFIQNDTDTTNIEVISLNFTPTSIGGTSNINNDQVVISWNGFTTPTNVTATGLMDITGGIVSTTAEANVVTAWDGSSAPLAVTAGTGIDITGGVISANAIAQTGNRTLASIRTPTLNYPALGGSTTLVWLLLGGSNVIQPFSFPVGDVIKIECVGDWNWDIPDPSIIGPSAINVTFGALLNLSTTDTNPSPRSPVDGGSANFTLMLVRSGTTTIRVSGNGNVLKDGAFVNNFSFPITFTNVYDESVAYPIEVNWTKGLVALGVGTYNFVCRALSISQLSP